MCSEQEDWAAWRLWQSWDTSWYFLIMIQIRQKCVVSIYLMQHSLQSSSMKESLCACLYLRCKSNCSCSSWFSRVWEEIVESWFWIFCFSSLISSLKELMCWEQITDVSRHKIRDMTRVQTQWVCVCMCVRVCVCVYLVSSVQSRISLIQFLVQAFQVLTESTIRLHLLC